MKTAPITPFNFSGYPLAPVASAESNTATKRKLDAGITAKPVATKHGKTVNKVDVPENWDESWFGNYE